MRRSHKPVIYSDELGQGVHDSLERRIASPRFGKADCIRNRVKSDVAHRVDASGWDGILIQTFYRPAATLWEEANRMARHSIRFFSEKWGRYPYPHATTIEGPIEGMEYPMLTFVPASAKREDLYWVLMHEFGHEWFPMLVGSDERRYPCFGLALAAARAGGTAPAVLSAANELAVESFLAGRVPYTAIPELIASALEALPARPVTSVDDIFAADLETRRWVREHHTTATRGDGR